MVVMEKTDSKYIIINELKYDIKEWEHQHPGGNVFTNFDKNDCTAVFNAYHNSNCSKIKSILQKLLIPLKEIEYTLSKIDQDYLDLNVLFTKLGFYEISRFYYIVKVSIVFVLFVIAIIFNGESDIISGSALGLMIQQSAFIGHDLGHNSILSKVNGIFNTKYKYIWAFIFGNVLLGVDGLNWSVNHNEHHFTPCVPGIDQQNDHLPFVLYKNREIEILDYKLSDINKLLLKAQWIYILPLLFSIGKINFMLDIDNSKLLNDKNYVRMFGIILHVGIWYCLISNSINKLYFIIFALLFNGMIHVQIILSHAFMPRLTIDEMHSKGWIVSQAITTMNIKTYWYDDWFHGGLQFQYDHHLFPRIPRHNLKHIQPYIIDFCKKHDIKYNIMSFHEAIIQMLRSLYIEAKVIN